MKASYLAFVLSIIVTAVSYSSGDASPPYIKRSWWPGGILRLEIYYHDNVRHGPYRSWYQNGRPYESRNYVLGREHGIQRAWTPDGELYLNFEVWNGRRYGYVNAQPCRPVLENGMTS